MNVYEGHMATVDDVMQLLVRLSYLDLIDFAGAVSGDADKMADAAKAWIDAEDEKEAGK